jgi:hypothetical protein
LASIASTTHWSPKTRASSSISAGRASAAELTETRERHEHLVGRAARELDDGRALVGGRRDVEEHELVGAGAVVVGGELDGVAGVADVNEARALDDAAGVDVHARDDALVMHYESAACPSPTVKRPS